MTFRVDPSLNGYDQIRIKRFYQQLVDDIRRIPGVLSASIAQVPVLTGNASSRTVQVLGYEPKQDENMNPWTNEVDRTTSARWACRWSSVANSTIATSPARRWSPSSTRRSRSTSSARESHRAPLRVRGHERSRRRSKSSASSRTRSTPTCGRARRDENETPRVVYTPFQQSQEINEMTFYVRGTRHAPRSHARTAAADRSSRRCRMPVFEMQSMEQTVDEALFNERMLALLSASFGLLATALAAIGLYGVMSYTVRAGRARSAFASRLAPSAATVLWLVLREVALLTVIGIGAGVPGALALSRLVQSQLFGIEPAIR